MTENENPILSIFIPLYNEEDNLEPLYEKLREVLDGLGQSFEVIFINDGSHDHSEEVLAALAGRDKRVRVISFRRNFGQTAAMMAGIDHARGTILIPMDSDLQNDPADIPLLLQKLEEGYDVVSGWRQDRQDHPIRRNWLSRVANRLISVISGVHLHDYGCSLKAYRRDVIKPVKLYGEMHRFIPIFATWQGARVTELPVRHHPRIHGVSKYGLERVLKVVLDLLVIKFLAHYDTKPIYIFGGFGLLSILLSILSGSYALYLKFVHGVSFILTPLPLLVVMTFLAGMTSILMGLLAELIIRGYYESQGKPIYLIKRKLNFGEETRGAGLPDW